MSFYRTAIDFTLYFLKGCECWRDTLFLILIKKTRGLHDWATTFKILERYELI